MHTNYFDSVLAPQPNTLHPRIVKNDDQDENENPIESTGPI